MYFLIYETSLFFLLLLITKASSSSLFIFSSKYFHIKPVDHSIPDPIVTNNQISLPHLCKITLWQRGSDVHLSSQGPLALLLLSKYPPPSSLSIESTNHFLCTANNNLQNDYHLNRHDHDHLIIMNLLPGSYSRKKMRNVRSMIDKVASALQQSTNLINQVNSVVLNNRLILATSIFKIKPHPPVPSLSPLLQFSYNKERLLSFIDYGNIKLVYNRYSIVLIQTCCEDKTIRIIGNHFRLVQVIPNKKKRREEEEESQLIELKGKPIYTPPRMKSELSGVMYEFRIDFEPDQTFIVILFSEFSEDSFDELHLTGLELLEKGGFSISDDGAMNPQKIDSNSDVISFKTILDEFDNIFPPSRLLSITFSQAQFYNEQDFIMTCIMSTKVLQHYIIKHGNVEYSISMLLTQTNLLIRTTEGYVCVWQESDAPFFDHVYLDKDGIGTVTVDKGTIIYFFPVNTEHEYDLINLSIISNDDSLVYTERLPCVKFLIDYSSDTL